MSLGTEIETVAVLDDSDDDREMTVLAVEAAGFNAFVLPYIASIDEAIRQIQGNAQALVSDHNLKWGGGADFTGAELVDRCYQAGIPAILVTGYMMDTNTTIREFRRGVPDLVSRSDLDGDRLRAAIDTARQELSDRPRRERVPHAALLRVDRVNPEARQVDVVVPQWDPHSKVSMPMSMLGDRHLPENLEELVEKRFLAQINTGAENESDLYFAEIEDAGDLPDESDLE